MDLLGKWHGVYSYHPAFKQDSVPFELDITEHANGKFAGTVQDDPKHGGDPAQGTIRGTIKSDALIKFAKQMPSRRLRGRNGEVFIQEGVPYTIYYEGVLGSGGAFSGTWRIPFKLGFKGPTTLPTSGTWSLWRDK